MSISHELAKKLKDAGFPQTIFVNTGDLDVVIPTLEELIEACPKIRKLERERNDGHLALSHQYTSGYGRGMEDMTWKAGYDRLEDYEGNGFDTDLIGFGSTPSEAVANLWLALNQKK